jgi:hypothetical protein
VIEGLGDGSALETDGHHKVGAGIAKIGNLGAKMGATS